MRFYETDDPEVLATRRGKGAGCMQALVALPFLGMGAGAFLAAFGEMDLGWPGWASALLGALFAATGLLLLAYRGGMEVDRRRGVLVNWGGVPGLRRTREIPLDSIQRIAIYKKTLQKTRQGMPVADVFYPVILEARGDAVRLANFRDYRKSLAVAEHSAQVFGVEMEDRSGDEGGVSN